MRCTVSKGIGAALLAGVCLALGWSGGAGRSAAGPINPKVYKIKFDEASKTARAYPYWHQAQFKERNPLPV